MKTRILFTVTLCLATLPGLAYGQSIAIYPVQTEGFEMNQSEVYEMHRIALQACYDAGLRCSGRGDTTSAVQREQAFGGGGQIASAPYVAECALTGKTAERVNLGTKQGGIDIIGGAAKRVGGDTWVGAASQLGTSGLRIGAGGMNLTCQFTRTADGVLVFSGTDEKMGISGELILVEAKSSNTKKVQKAFKKMFEKAKPRLADG